MKKLLFILIAALYCILGFAQKVKIHSDEITKNGTRLITVNTMDGGIKVKGVGIWATSVTYCESVDTADVTFSLILKIKAEAKGGDNVIYFKTENNKVEEKSCKVTTAKYNGRFINVAILKMSKSEFETIVADKIKKIRILSTDIEKPIDIESDEYVSVFEETLSLIKERLGKKINNLDNF